MRTIDIGTWIVLDVCQTCYYMVGAGDEINDTTDARSAEALDVHWQGYNLWVDCGGDGCESEHAWMCVSEGCDPDDDCVGFTHRWGHHAGGFTWSPCDVCGQGGRDSYRVIAEKRAEPPAALTVAVSHEITAGDIRRGDTLLAVEGVEDLPLPLKVADTEPSPFGVYVKLRGVDGFLRAGWEYFGSDVPVTVLFAASC